MCYFSWNFPACTKISQAEPIWLLCNAVYAEIFMGQKPALLFHGHEVRSMCFLTDRRSSLSHQQAVGLPMLWVPFSSSTQTHWVCASKEVSSPWTKSIPQPPDPFVTPVYWKALSVDVDVDQDDINILLGFYFLHKTRIKMNPFLIMGTRWWKRKPTVRTG